MKTFCRTLVLVWLTCWVGFTTHVLAQTSAFSYQGRLMDNGLPANGQYDFSFTLHDQAEDGNESEPLAINSVTVSRGAFSVTLDFGAEVFNGDDRWLQVQVRPHGSVGNYTTLTPRQLITPAPYAIFAPNSQSGEISADNLTSGTLADQRLSSNVALLDRANLFTSLNRFSAVTILTNKANVLAGDGSGLRNVPGTISWQTVGESSHPATANQAYLLTNDALTTITLPATANVGDVVTVTGAGVAGWQVTTDLEGGGIVGSGRYATLGSTWTARDSDRDWRAVASSADGRKLVAVTAGYIYTSTDSGTIWTQRGVPHAWTSVASSTDGEKLVAGTDGGKIYTSTDAGVTWTPRDSNRYWFRVASSADGQKLVAVVHGGKIYTSTDAGVTWTPRENDRGWYAVASSSDGTKLVAGEWSGPLYTSTDGGETWTVRALSGSWVSAASSADGVKLVALDGANGLYTSTDSGATWQLSYNPGSVSAMAASADGDTIVVTSYSGSILVSLDAGATWVEKPGTRLYVTLAISADGTKLVAGTQGDKIYTSVGTVPLLTGQTGTTVTLQHIGDGQWQPVAVSQIGANTVGNAQVTALDAAKLTSGTLNDARLSGNVALLNGTNVFTGTNTFTGEVAISGTVISTNEANVIAGDGSGLRNVPGTITWQTVVGNAQTVTANQAYLLTNDSLTTITLPTTANVGDVVTVRGAGTAEWQVTTANEESRIVGIGSYTALGETWVARDSDRDWRGVASSADGTKLVAVTAGYIYTSTDSGMTWTQRGIPQWWASVASSADGEKLVAVVPEGQIYTSTDSGVTWTPRESTRFWFNVASSADGEKLVAVVPEGRIYTSTDSGVTWTPRESDRIWVAAASSADGTKLVAAVYSGQIYTSTDSGETWTPREEDRSWISVASSADGTKLVALDHQNGLYTSTDSGVTWELSYSPDAPTSMAASADGNTIVVTSDYGPIYISLDAGASWTEKPETQSWVAIAMSADGRKLVAATYSEKIYTSEAGWPRLTGQSGATVTLQYMGDGQWQPVVASQVGANTVGNTQVSALDAAKLTSGTLSDARLSSNVALLNGTNVFTGTNSFAGVAKLTNAANVFVGDGSGLTGLNAAQLLSGTIDDARLPANVPRLDGTNVFTGTNTFADVAGNGSGLTALNASQLTAGTLPNGRLTGTYANAVTLNNAANHFTGDGSGLRNVPVASPWQTVTGGRQTAAANLAYLLTNDTPTTVVLPAAPKAGDTVTVTGAGASGWNVATESNGSSIVGAGTYVPAGETWNAREENRMWQVIASSADGTKLAAVVYNGQIYTSTDSGVTWTPRESNRSWCSVASSADGTKLVATVLAGQIYTSTDSGATWTARESNRQWNTVASSADGVRLVAVVEYGKIYVSTNSGVTWTAYESNRRWRSVAASADGLRLVAGVRAEAIYTSYDGGIVWTPHGQNGDWLSLASSADGQRLAAVDYYGKIYTSTATIPVISGGAGTTATLQYIGNGQWQPLAGSQVGANTVSNAQVSALDAAKLTSGTLSDARLSANVALLNGTNVFTGTNRFAGATSLTNTANQYAGDGSGLTGLNAAQLASGTINLSRLPVSVALLEGTNVFTGTNTFAAVAKLTNTANVFVGDGSGLTGLNAAQLLSGTINQARLPANVPLLNGTNVFTGTNSFAGVVKFTNAANIFVGDGSGLTGLIGLDATQLQGTINPARLPVNVALLEGTNVFTGTNNFAGVARLTNMANHFTGDGSGLRNVPGATPWQTVVGSSQTATANQAYLLTNDSLTTVFLPAAASVGDVVIVTGAGTGSWQVGANSAGASIVGIGNYYTLEGTWTAHASDDNWSALAASADGKKLVAAAFFGPIITSIDGGENWTTQAIYRGWWAVASSADGTKLVAGAYNDSIYTSTDSGLTWTPRESARNWVSVASSANGEKLVAIDFGFGGGGRIYTSTNSGETWIPRDSVRNWRSVVSSADGTKLAIVESGEAIYISTDSGETWIPRESTRDWSLVAISADGTKLVAYDQTGAIYTSTDSGLTWVPRADFDGMIALVSSADGNILATTGYGEAIYVSTDAGITWTQKSEVKPWRSLAISADGSKLMAGTQDEKVYIAAGQVSVLKGEAGTTATLQYIGNGQWQPVATSQIGANTVSNAQVFALDAAKLTSGTLGGDRLAGTYGQAMTFDNAANVLAGDGSGLTGLNASQLTSGTLDDARLSSNVAFLNGTNVFTGTNRFAGVAILTNTANVFVGDGSGLTGLNTAQLANGTLSSDRLAGTYGNALTFSNPENSFKGAFSGNGAMPWQVVAGTSVNAVSGNAYLLTNSELVTVTLPANPAVGDIVRVTGKGVFKLAQNSGQFIHAENMTSIQGVTWAARDSSSRIWKSIASSSDGTKLVAAAAGGQIYTSTNSGVTWATRENNRLWYSVASSADGTKLVAVEHDGQIYTSVNSGTNWVARLTGTNRNWRVVASSSDGTKLVAGAAGDQLYTSTDSGVNWTTRASDRSWSAVASSSDGVKLVAAVDGGQIYTSTNSGTTWTARENNRHWVSLASSADGTKLVAAELGGQLYTSTDSGTNWTARITYLNRRWSAVASSADGTKLVAVAEDEDLGGHIYTSIDSGVNWTARMTDASRDWYAVASSADGTKLVAGVINGYIYTSATSAVSTTPVGTVGWLEAASRTSIELQYLGDGEFLILSSSGSFFSN